MTTSKTGIAAWFRRNFGEEPIFVEIPVPDPESVPHVVHIPVKATKVAKPLRKPTKPKRKPAKRGKP